MRDPKDLVRRQFGANAANYATSTVHAKGESLRRLVELVEPRAEWTALDVATGGGHMAFAVAPHVASVIASDLTDEMLDVAALGAADRGLDNVTTARSDAEALDFDNGTFDLVTCRIAPHHFPHPDRFVAEVARVLRPGGVFGLVDNVAAEDPDVARFYNDWEMRRDPSHVRALPMSEWQALLEHHGFRIAAQEIMRKAMAFQDWADNMDVSEPLRAELWDDLTSAGPAVHAFLEPSPGQFVLTEGIFVATT